MKVQGVDPLIMNRIQEQTSKQSVQETKQAKISGEQKQKKKKNQQENISENTLLVSVLKLNDAAEALNIQVYFQIDKDEDGFVVLMIDKEEKKIVGRIAPEKVLDMLAQMKTMVGMLVDRLI